MKRPIILSIFTIATSFFIFGVMWIAIMSKGVYENTFGLWYFYATMLLLSLWQISMYGLYCMRFWGAALCISTVSIHQIVLCVAGAWSLSQLPLLVVPLVLVAWLKFTNRLTH